MKKNECVEVSKLLNGTLYDMEKVTYKISKNEKLFKTHEKVSDSLHYLQILMKY